jgi:hypothetical protein
LTRRLEGKVGLQQSVRVKILECLRDWYTSAAGGEGGAAHLLFATTVARVVGMGMMPLFGSDRQRCARSGMDRWKVV